MLAALSSWLFPTAHAASKTSESTSAMMDELRERSFACMDELIKNPLFQDVDEMYLLRGACSTEVKVGGDDPTRGDRVFRFVGWRDDEWYRVLKVPTNGEVPTGLNIHKNGLPPNEVEQDVALSPFGVGLFATPCGRELAAVVRSVDATGLAARDAVRALRECAGEHHQFYEGFVDMHARLGDIDKIREHAARIQAERSS